MSELILSDKYKEFLRHNAEAEALEGTTAAGKTTVGAFKFMLKVAKSPKKLHFIASKSIGDAEKNIINSDLGIVDIFGDLVQYRGNGSIDYKISHLVYHVDDNPEHDKIIFILGYEDKTKWKKALGSQFGCGYIDEINTADTDFIQESTMRCDYWMCTMNPDDPNLPVYEQYINRFRSLDKYINDTPKEIQDELNKQPAHPNWTYWFFNFDHNAGLPEEKKQQIIGTVAVGTKIYKNKILGLRGRAEGLIFPMFERQRNVIARSQAKKFDYVKYSCGVDTSYSEHSNDTIAFMFQGITKDGTLVTLAEKVYNNKDLNGDKIAPSDVVRFLHKFLDNCKDSWGFARKIYVDSADQATVMELRKYASKYGLIYEFMNANKSIKIIDRINLMAGWMKQGCYLVVDDCVEHIHELEVYNWKENKDEPEDRNDHTINAGQYGWIPYLKQIGNKQANANQFDTLRAGFGL
ncbi:TPA: terminase family protein [Streptococcus suis]|uniref:terminase large subunit domain-containing protein n=1 Tax=Streptococcus suis TaxID=1307 RepID=UPI0005CDCA23|nr:terminase family protein [Streptococcus suis]NQI41942.1 terminase [Streptococcus suis]CYU12585.1 phage terminase%2C large subunit [Streptococcus suis]